MRNEYGIVYYPDGNKYKGNFKNMEYYIILMEVYMKVNLKIIIEKVMH